MNKKKLSIVFVTNNYLPYQGGIVSSILATRQALRNLGHSVHLITLDFTGNHTPEKEVIRLTCPVRFRYKKNHMAIPWLPYQTIQHLLKQLTPDIVHIHHPFLLGYAALHAAKKSNIPTVFTYHTLYEQYLHYVPLPKLFTQHALQKRIGSFCNTIDGIIAPGMHLKEQIRNYALQTPLQVIPSSIAQIFFELQPTQYKNTTAPYTLLTVSRFTHEKNITFLLDVMKLLENTNLRLILAGYGSAYDQLRAYAYTIKKLSPDKVIFIEKPSKEQLLRLYGQADLFLFASTSDTQGLVLAEAMSQGTPVIAVHGPGQQDIVKNGINGFLVESREEMRERIQQTFNDKNLFEAMQAGAMASSQHYQPYNLITILEEFYFNLITHCPIR